MSENTSTPPTSGQEAGNAIVLEIPLLKVDGDTDVCCGMIVAQLTGMQHEYRSFMYCPYCGDDISDIVRLAVINGLVV